MSESSDILALSPTAYWPLNDSSGSSSAADASGNGHPAAASGAATFGVSASQPGDTDTGCQLGSTSAYLQAAASSAWSIGTADFTAGCWVKLSTNPSVTAVLLGQYTGTNSTGWYFGLNTAGKPQYAMGANAAIAGSNALDDGNWHLIVCRRAAGNVSLNVDGTDLAGTSSTFSTSLGIATTNGFGVLNLNPTINTYGFLGVAKKAFFINGTAISDSAIAQLYSAAMTSAAFAAGTLSVSSFTSSSVSLSIATNSGGAAPYSSQLQRSPHGANSWSNVGSAQSGATASFVDSTASSAASYDYQVLVTDSASNTATSNTVNVATLNFIAATDSRFQYNGRWAQNGSAFETINNGSQLEFDYTGQTCNLLFDTAIDAAVYPIVATWIDQAGPTRITLTGAGSVTLSPAYNTAPTGSPPYGSVSSSRHAVRLLANVDAGNSGTTNWSTQNAALLFKGIEIDSTASLLTIPQSPDLIEFNGDSITAGLRVLYASGATDLPAINAPELAWPRMVAEQLGMKPIVNGHGGQGITTSGTDGAPQAAAAFGFCWSGQAWSPPIKPKVVVVYQGTNDSSFTAAQYQSLLTTIRAAYPSAFIFAFVPHNKTGLSSIISTAVSGVDDARTIFFDYSSGIISAAADQADSIGHLNPGGNVTLAAKMASDIRTTLTAFGVSVQPPTSTGSRKPH